VLDAVLIVIGPKVATGEEIFPEVSTDTTWKYQVPSGSAVEADVNDVSTILFGTVLAL